jgi:hypothetical protein
MAASVLLAASLAGAAWGFAGIVRKYRKLSGFPWARALVFAAAAAAALIALHALFEG